MTIFFIAISQFIQKCLSARFCNRTQMLNGILFVHTDAIIAKGNGFGSIINVDTNRKLAIIFIQAIIRGCQKSQLITSIRGI